MELRIYDPINRHYIKDPNKYKGDKSNLRWVVKTEWGENVHLSNKFSIREYNQGTFSPPENILAVTNKKGAIAKGNFKAESKELFARNLKTGAVTPLDIDPLLVTPENLKKANALQKGQKLIVPEGIKFASSDKKQKEPIHFLTGGNSKHKTQVKIFSQDGEFEKSLFGHKFVKLGAGDRVVLRNLNLDGDRIQKEFNIRGRGNTIRAILSKAYQHIGGDELMIRRSWDVFVEGWYNGQDLISGNFGFDNVDFGQLLHSLEDQIINALWTQGYHFSNPTSLQAPELARFSDELEDGELSRMDGELVLKFKAWE